MADLHITDSSRYYPVPITFPGSSLHLPGHSNLNLFPDTPTKLAPVLAHSTFPSLSEIRSTFFLS